LTEHRFRKLFTWCTLAGLIAVALPGGPAAAAPPTLDDIYQKLGVDNVSAEYVILVDESLSMKTDGLYDHVLTSLRQFFAALAPQDDVTLVTIADNAQVIWQGKAGTSPDSLVGKLPPAPTGQHTDLGLGIQAAIDALEQHPTDPIASVVLLTDGQHDPAPGSPYPLTEGYAWQQLIARAAKLKAQVDPYAIQLRGQSGAQLLQKVFPSAKVLSTDAVDQLTGQLAQPKETVKAAKAKARLAGDAKPTVAVSWSSQVRGLHDGTVTLRNTSRYIPLDVANLSVSSAAAVSVPTKPIHLEPGASTTVPVTVHWDPGPSSWSPFKTVHRTVPLTLHGDVTSSWTDVLSKNVGLSIAPALGNATVDGAGSAERGSLTWWVIGLIGLLLVLLAGLRVRWLRLHPVPGGRLVALPLAFDGSGGSMPLQRRREPINAGSLGISGTGEVAGVRHGARTGELISITYSDDGTVNGRLFAECEPGGTVDIHEVRFEWQR
jgi:hypothetical protein